MIAPTTPLTLDFAALTVTASGSSVMSSMPPLMLTLTLAAQGEAEPRE